MKRKQKMHLFTAAVMIAMSLAVCVQADAAGNSITSGRKTISKIEASNAKADAGTKAASKEERLIDKIARLASLKANVEENELSCAIDVNSKKNPYGVTWKYGFEYDNFTKGLDWDMVFNAGYYKETFPGLALQYQDNDKLLFEHFRTVGIHEGRQGSKNFNVAAYMKVCSSGIKSLFGNNYAAYYLYWMAEGYMETDASDVKGSSEPRQLVAVLTKVQAKEIGKLNADRKKLSIKPIIFDSELAAIGEFRAWVDAKEGWKAHDWMNAKENQEVVDELFDILHVDTFSENTVKASYVMSDWYSNYYNSKSHHDAMFNPENIYFGPSNPHTGIQVVQFDMFAKKDMDTPLNKKGRA